MFLKLDGDRPDTSAVLVVVTVTLGEDQISRDVEIVLDHLKLTIEPSLLLFLPSYLPLGQPTLYYPGLPPP